MADPLSEERIAEARCTAEWALEGKKMMWMPRELETILAALALAERFGKAPRYFGTTPEHPSEVEMVCVADIAPVVAAEGE